MLLFVCTMILYRYMELLKTDVHNLCEVKYMGNFSAVFVCIANEGCHIKMSDTSSNLFRFIFMFIFCCVVLSIQIMICLNYLSSRWYMPYT
jgi:hypothetical protein